MANKRDKVPKFTDREQSLIVTYMKTHREVLNGRRCGASKSGTDPKKLLLETIVKECTRISTILRTPTSIDTKIKNWQ